MVVPNPKLVLALMGWMVLVWFALGEARSRPPSPGALHQIDGIVREVSVYSRRPVRFELAIESAGETTQFSNDYIANKRQVIKSLPDEGDSVTIWIAPASPYGNTLWQLHRGETVVFSYEQMLTAHAGRRQKSGLLVGMFLGGLLLWIVAAFLVKRTTLTDDTRHPAA